MAQEDFRTHRHETMKDPVRMSPVQELPQEVVVLDRRLAGCRCLVLFLVLSGSALSAVSYGLWKAVQSTLASATRETSISATQSSVSPLSSSSAAPPQSQSSMVSIMISPQMKSVIRRVSNGAEDFNAAWKARGLPLIPWEECVAVESSLNDEEVLRFTNMGMVPTDLIKVYSVTMPTGITRRVFILPDGSVMVEEE